MSTFKNIIKAFSDVAVGHRTTDNLEDWHHAHQKANIAREDVRRTIEEAKLLEQSKLWEPKSKSDNGTHRKE